MIHYSTRIIPNGMEDEIEQEIAVEFKVTQWPGMDSWYEQGDPAEIEIESIGVIIPIKEAEYTEGENLPFDTNQALWERMEQEILSDGDYFSADAGPDPDESCNEWTDRD